MVLRDPTVDMAVIETARGGIVRAGLGYRFCDVGAVLNVTSDHLGLGGVNSLDELAEVKRLVVEVAKDTAVLNADNEHTLKMAAYTQAKHICYVTRNPDHPLVREHIKLGQRAVVLEQGLNGDQIVIYDHGNQLPLIWTHLIPATVEGKALHNVENAMFTAAMAYALGLSLDQIRTGLRTFDNTFFQSPGRMNIFDEHGFRVILDYGHNEAAVGAMVDLVERLQPLGKRIVCVTAPGDRRDEDIRDIAAQGRRPLRHLPLPRRRQPARPRPRRGAEADEGGADRARRPRGRDRARRERDRLDRHRARHGPPERPRADLLRRDHPLLEADHLLPPQRAAEAGAAGAPGRRLGLRRAGGLPGAQRRARRPHRAPRLTGAHGSPAGAPAAGRSLAVIGGRLEDSNVAVFAEMHRLAGGRILVFPTASAEPEAVGAGEPAGLPRARLRRRGGAAHPENAAASPSDPALVARVARLRQRLLHRRRPGQYRRLARAGRRRDPAPRRHPRRPAPPAAWWRAPAPARR